MQEIKENSNMIPNKLELEWLEQHIQTFYDNDKSLNIRLTSISH